MSAPFQISASMRSRKIAALDFIKRYFARWGFSPSLSEVGAALGVSKQRAHELVEQLSDEHQVRVVSGKQRGIRLIDPGDEISIADAVLRLRREGMRVLHDGDTLDQLLAPIAEPLTKPQLLPPPDLDYLPDIND